MPADASPRFTRRAFLGGSDRGGTQISSLVVRANPQRLAEVVRRIGKIRAAEVALSDPSGKLVIALETASESAIVEAMNAMQRIDGVVSVALVYHQTEPGGAET